MQVGRNHLALREVHKSPQLLVCGLTGMQLFMMFLLPSELSLLYQKHVLICYNILELQGDKCLISLIDMCFACEDTMK